MLSHQDFTKPDLWHLLMVKKDGVRFFYYNPHGQNINPHLV